MERFIGDHKQMKRKSSCLKRFISGAEGRKRELQGWKSRNCPEELWRRVQNWKISLRSNSQLVGVLKGQNTDRGIETVKEIIYPELKGDLQIQRIQKIDGKSRMKKRPIIRGIIINSQNMKDLK